MRFVLLHSPLLGPFAWQAVAELLRGRGHVAEAPAWLRLSQVGGGFYAALAADMAGKVRGEPAVLVAHSGAGALMPALVAALETPPVGVVFADAILPHPGRSWFDTAPPQFVADLRAGADEGWLPAWSDWWPPGALERLVPDETARAALLAELEALPLDYFEERAPDTPLASQAAYLQMSGSYEDEGVAAGRMAWPLVSLPLTHLAMVAQPTPVAAAVEGLGARLALSA